MRDWEGPVVKLPMAVKTYDQVHAGLFWAYGKASEHDCLGCGSPAHHWCYMYNAGEDEKVDEKGRKFSEDFDHYAPLCWRCHKTFDVANDPRLREGMKLNGRRMAARLSPEQRSRAGRSSMSLRRRCRDCKMVASPSSMGRHQKYTGHSGWVDLTTAREPEN